MEKTKLRELLDEYIELIWEQDIWEIPTNKIISKSRGFISWLVENDKIDFDNRDLKDRFMDEFERYPQFQNNTTNREFNINGLLMLLAIQDEPIRFLCEILK